MEKNPALIPTPFEESDSDNRWFSLVRYFKISIFLYSLKKLYLIKIKARAVQKRNKIQRTKCSIDRRHDNSTHATFRGMEETFRTVALLKLRHSERPSREHPMADRKRRTGLRNRS